jgi:hypothetical protein
LAFPDVARWALKFDMSASRSLMYMTAEVAGKGQFCDISTAYLSVAPGLRLFE